MPLCRFLPLLLALALIGCSSDPKKLNVQVFTSSPEGYSVTTTLISGDRDAIIVDPQFLLSEAHRIAAEIKKTGKSVTTIYTTHAHPDHFFGIAAMKEEFPNAKYVALPTVVERMKTAWPARLKYWRNQGSGDDLPGEDPILPEPLAEPKLMLEGQALEITGDVMGDIPGNSYIWIPSTKAVIAGDVVFNKAHFGVPADPSPWIAALDQIAALQPAIVVAGHQGMGATTEPQVVEWMKTYLADFAALKAESKNGPELESKMLQKYPGLALEDLLDRSSNAAFAPPPKQ